MGYFGTFICYKMNVSEEIMAYVFFVFTLIGALSAAAYGSLPQAHLSEKARHELEEMLEKMKNEEVEERNIIWEKRDRKYFKLYGLRIITYAIAL